MLPKKRTVAKKTKRPSSQFGNLLENKNKVGRSVDPAPNPAFLIIDPWETDK
jgi:hypothetical protein